MQVETFVNRQLTFLNGNVVQEDGLGDHTPTVLSNGWR